MLLDQHGHPIKVADLKKEIAAPAAYGARAIASRSQSWGLDPARLSRLLRAAEENDPAAYLELAEEMEEKYLHYAAQLATRKRAVSGITAEIIPATDSRRDRRIAEVVEESLPVIQQATFDMLDSLGKGFSATEIIWDTTGANWFPVRLERRDPRHFLFDKVDGRTLRLKSDLHPDGEDLPPANSFCTRAPRRRGCRFAAAWPAPRPGPICSRISPSGTG